MYRSLTQQEIEILEKRGCSASDWSSVEVKDPFNVNRLTNVSFSGTALLGSNSGNPVVENNLNKPSGITNCYIENCTIGDDVCLSNIGSLANYNIGDKCVVIDVSILAVTGKTFFGNGHEIEILNEGGGRELPIFDRLSAQIAYLMVLYRHNRQFISRLKELIFRYVSTIESKTGQIGEGSRIINAGRIINVNIGSYATIRGVVNLEEGTIKSTKTAPVFIGEGVNCHNFIVLTGSKIDSGAIVASTFIGQGVKMGKQFSSENSAFFANCEAFHGEACSIFAGPYTITHHKSTLLIAGLFSFYNAGSGTNQSNHMYKLGPVHQGVLERGSKTGSFSYMLWPCRVGAFSVVMDKHSGNFDTSDLPFSYITVQDDKSLLTPAMNLFTVGTSRDSVKWPQRDQRKGEDKIDLITFPIFNPYTVQKMINGSVLLDRLNSSAPKNRELVSYKGIFINRLMLRTSKRYYDLAIIVYLLGELVKRLVDSEYGSLSEVRDILSAGVENYNQDAWVDIAGMITDKAAVDNIITSVINQSITSVDNLLARLEDTWKEYDKRSWSWCVAAINNFMGVDIKKVTGQELMNLAEEWKNSSVKFNNIILKDAEKEFDQLSRISFGIDGNEKDKLADFEAIRGKYGTNSFVAGLQQDSLRIDKVHQLLMTKLGNLSE
jgi:hypothetical protein